MNVRSNRTAAWYGGMLKEISMIYVNRLSTAASAVRDTQEDEYNAHQRSAMARRPGKGDDLHRHLSDQPDLYWLCGDCARELLRAGESPPPHGVDRLSMAMNVAEDRRKRRKNQLN